MTKELTVLSHQQASGIAATSESLDMIIESLDRRGVIESRMPLFQFF
jgi:hypothetical protein